MRAISSRVRVRIMVRIRFSAWLVRGYAQAFVQLSIVIVTLPKNDYLRTICMSFQLSKTCSAKIYLRLIDRNTSISSCTIHITININGQLKKLPCQPEFVIIFNATFLFRFIVVPVNSRIANWLTWRQLWRNGTQKIGSPTLLGKPHILAIRFFYPQAFRWLLRWLICLIAEAWNLRDWRWYDGLSVLLPCRSMIEPTWYHRTG